MCHLLVSFRRLLIVYRVYKLYKSGCYGKDCLMIMITKCIDGWDVDTERCVCLHTDLLVTVEQDPSVLCPNNFFFLIIILPSFYNVVSMLNH